MRDLLSLDPPRSASSEDAPYAVLLLSTDHDLAFVVRTLQKRRHAPPTCVAVVLDAVPAGSSTSFGMRLEDVADRIFFWDQEGGKIRELAPADDEADEESASGSGSEGSSDDESVETASETASDSSPEGGSGQTSEPTSPPPTLSRDGSADEAVSTSDPPPEPTPAPAAVVESEDSPPTAPVLNTPRREQPHHPKPSKPGLVDGVYVHAAAVPNTSLAYHSSRPSSRVPSRSPTPPPAPILKTQSPSPPRSTPTSMSRRLGAPSRIPISGLDGFRPFPGSPSELRQTPQIDLDRMREASVSFGGSRAAAMTGLLSPSIRASFPLSPSSSGPFSSLPPTPSGRSASSPLAGMSVASTPGAGGNDFGVRTGRAAKARQRVVSLGMLSPGFERMAESADAKREAEEGRAAEAWRTGRSAEYPFPAGASGAEEEEDAVE